MLLLVVALIYHVGKEERQCCVLVNSWALKWNSWIRFFIVLFASFVILSKLTFLGLSVHIYKMEIVSVPSMLATVVNVVVGFISWPVTPGRIKVCCIHTSVPLWALFIPGMMSEIREPNIPVAWDISCLWLRFFSPTAQWVQWVQVISFLLMDIFSLVPYLGNQGFLAYHSEKINLYWFFFPLPQAVS